MISESGIVACETVNNGVKNNNATINIVVLESAIHCVREYSSFLTINIRWTENASLYPIIF